MHRFAFSSPHEESVKLGRTPPLISASAVSAAALAIFLRRRPLFPRAGTAAEDAGRSAACAGCPNQAACATAPKGPDPDVAAIAASLAGVKHKASAAPESLPWGGSRGQFWGGGGKAHSLILRVFGPRAMAEA